MTDKQQPIIKFDDACRAISEATRVDEVLLIRDEAKAREAYAKQAKNKQLEADAVIIRVRAVRRLGEMMQTQPKAKGGGPGRGKTGFRREPSFSAPITLKEVGVDKRLADAARKTAAMTPAQFEQHVEAVRERVEHTPDTLFTTEAKKERRADRERELADKIVALPDKRYGLLYVDPEWRWEPWSRDTGMDRSAENHYPTSSLEEIARRPVASIAAKDCVLFLWATAPMLPEALEVLIAWGFDYKTHMVWRKQRPGKGRGTGYWVTGEHELLLIGTRGQVPAPATAMAPSVLEAPVGKHSEKPELFVELIEKQFPNVPKIELNRRGPARPGWDAWGNEVT